MIRPLNSTQANGMIESIKREINKRNLNTIDRLIIAHCDSVMLDQLTKNSSGQGILVIALPQSIWAMDSEMEQEMLEWVISELNVRSICLVGHSTGGTPDGLIQVYSSHSRDENRITHSPKVFLLVSSKGNNALCDASNISKIK